MTAVEELRRDLTKGRQRLLTVIAGVSEEQFKRRPPAEDTSPGWSIAEVLAHLLYSERLWGVGIALALSQDGTKIQDAALEARAEDARRGRMSPVPQLVHGLLASRRQVELLLAQAESLPDGLERHVLHPREGRQTVGWITREKVIAHEAEHVSQIEALRELLGVGAMPGSHSGVIQ